MAGLQALITGYRTAFPDLHVQIDELVATENTVVTSVTLTGTHLGDLLCIAPTGKPVAIHGMVRSRFRDGRIADAWEMLDVHSLLE